jgi:hypothetical protein
MKQKWLDRRIGCEGPYLTLCLNEKEFNGVARRLGVGTSGWLNARADATMRSFYGPAGLCCVVCLGDTSKRSGVEVAGLLIHEAVHIWQAWCSDVGESSPGEEQEAYAVQAIAQELMAEYARRVVMRDNMDSEVMQ